MKPLLLTIMIMAVLAIGTTQLLTSCTHSTTWEDGCKKTGEVWISKDHLASSALKCMEDHGGLKKGVVVSE